MYSDTSGTYHLTAQLLSSTQLLLSLSPVLVDSVPLADDDEGEAFDFDDSGDEVPEADRPPPALPAPPPPSSTAQSQGTHPEAHPPIPDPPAPTPVSDTAPSSAVVKSGGSTAAGATGDGQATSAGEGTDDAEIDLPPPPPLNDEAETDPGRTGLQSKMLTVLLLAVGK